MSAELLEKANLALQAGHHFEAERLAFEAVARAMKADDYEIMVHSIDRLWDARQIRYQQAIGTGNVIILDEPVEEPSLEAGCYLVQPPIVAADARRFRLAALSQEVSVAILCREPITAMGACPLVAIAPGATTRTRIDPPTNLDKPSIKWFTDAMLLIGDAAIDSVDPVSDIKRRMDAILARLDAIPEHEGLHLFLLDSAREAQEHVESTPPRKTAT